MHRDQFDLWKQAVHEWWPCMQNPMHLQPEMQSTPSNLPGQEGGTGVSHTGYLWLADSITAGVLSKYTLYDDCNHSDNEQLDVHEGPTILSFSITSLASTQAWAEATSMKSTYAKELLLPLCFSVMAPLPDFTVPNWLNSSLISSDVASCSSKSCSRQMWQ